MFVFPIFGRYANKLPVQTGGRWKILEGEGGSGCSNNLSGLGAETIRGRLGLNG